MFFSYDGDYYDEDDETENPEEDDGEQDSSFNVVKNIFAKSDKPTSNGLVDKVSYCTFITLRVFYFQMKKQMCRLINVVQKASASFLAFHL